MAAFRLQRPKVRASSFSTSGRVHLIFKMHPAVLLNMVTDYLSDLVRFFKRICVCRFNGAQFLLKWRGKKIMFVGDSLSFNMWISLSCMIHSWVPNARYTLVKTGSVLTDLTFLVSFLRSSFIFYIFFFWSIIINPTTFPFFLCYCFCYSCTPSSNHLKLFILFL